MRPLTIENTPTSSQQQSSSQSKSASRSKHAQKSVRSSSAHPTETSAHSSPYFGTSPSQHGGYTESSAYHLSQMSQDDGMSMFQSSSQRGGDDMSTLKDSEYSQHSATKTPVMIRYSDYNQNDAVDSPHMQHAGEETEHASEDYNMFMKPAKHTQDHDQEYTPATEIKTEHLRQMISKLATNNKKTAYTNIFTENF